MRDDAAFSTPIACTKPHTLELYNIVGLDPRLDAKIKDYTDVLDPSTPLYRAVRDQVYGRCLAPSVYGAAQRRAGGLPVQLGPSLSAKGGLHVAWDPFPAAPVGEGAAQVRVHLRAGRPRDPDVRRPAHPGRRRSRPGSV